jgi:protein SCO1/2
MQATPRRFNLLALAAIIMIALPSCSESSSDAKGSAATPESSPSREPTKDSLPYYVSSDLTPKWIDADDDRERERHTIGEFRFLDQTSTAVTRDTFAGKIYVADFFFTTCGGICPKLTRNLREVQDAFLDDDDVALISHTVTPKIDTVEQLAAYGKSRGVQPGKWHLVTGERAAIYRLARESYFAEGDLGIPPTSNRFLHTEKVFLVDKERRIRGVYDGTRAIDMRLLIDDIRTLKKEYEDDDAS